MSRNRIAIFALTGGIILAATIESAESTQDSPSSSGAPAGGSQRAAVLDLVRIFNECSQIQDLNELMKEQADGFAKEAAQRRKVIEDKQVELGAFRPGTQDHSARRKDLVRLNIDANVWLKVSEQTVEQEKFDWTRIIYEKSVTAAEEVAKERGYDIVLQRTPFKPDEIEQEVQALRRLVQDRAVIYHVPEIDITDLVIRRLDAAYKAAGGKKQLGELAPINASSP